MQMHFFFSDLGMNGSTYNMNEFSRSIIELCVCVRAVDLERDLVLTSL